MQHGVRLGPAQRIEGVRIGQRRERRTRAGPTFRRLNPRADGGPIGDAVQEAAQRVPFADAAGLADEHQEGGLESILGRVGIPQHPTANAEDRRAVALHQQGEGRLFAVAAEALQQFRVTQVFHGFRARVPAQLVEHTFQGRRLHGLALVGRKFPNPIGQQRRQLHESIRCGREKRMDVGSRLRLCKAASGSCFCAPSSENAVSNPARPRHYKERAFAACGVALLRQANPFEIVPSRQSR